MEKTDLRKQLRNTIQPSPEGATQTSPHLPQCACFFRNGAVKTKGYLKEKGLPLQRQKLHRDMAGVETSIRLIMEGPRP